MCATVSRRRKIVLDVGAYGGSTYIVKILNALSKFILFRFLGPYQTGIWSLLVMFMDWARYFDLGIGYSMSQRIPRALAHGRSTEVEEIQNLAFSYTVMTSGVLSFVILAAAFLMRPSLPPLFFESLMMLGVYVLFQHILHGYLNILNGYERFRFIGKYRILSSLSILVLMVYFASRFGIIGWISALLMNACLWLFLIIKESPRLRLISPFQGQIISLISSGVTLLALDGIFSIFRSIDRLVISHYLGIHAVGLYSLGITASSAVYVFSNSLKIVTLPHFEKEFVRRKRAEGMEKFLTKTVLSLVYSLLILIGIVWVCVPILTQYWLIHFTPALGTVKILTLGSFFLGLVQPLAVFMITIRKRARVFLGAAVVSCLLFVSEIAVIKTGGGIERIAVVSSTAFFFYFSANFYFSYRSLGSPKAFALLYPKVLLLFAYIAVFLFFTDGLLNLKAGVLYQFAAVTLGLIPIFLGLNRETAILQMVSELMFWKKQPVQAQLVENSTDQDL